MASNPADPRLGTADWDHWWEARLAKSGSDFLPYFNAPQVLHSGRSADVVNRDDALVRVMREAGLSTVLCAGNGVSQEPRALAAGGLDVTALDLSPLASAAAQRFALDARSVDRFVAPQNLAPGGRVRFVVGDLMDASICPGPFDVVIERRTIQRFPEDERAAALGVLARRLGDRGILVSHCNDDQFPPEWGWAANAPDGLFHASEAWLREHGWTLWEGRPDAPLTGRVAWLIRSGSMKRPPART